MMRSDALTGWQNDYRLAVISNFDKRLRRVLEDLGIAGRFERIFISSEIGCEKPDPEIFRRVLDVMNVNARSVPARRGRSRERLGRRRGGGNASLPSEPSGRDA